jgi:hypothetical protein
VRANARRASDRDGSVSDLANSAPGYHSVRPDDYTSETSRLTGSIEWVQIDIDAAAADEDHLISPEERRRLAMACQ